MKAYKSIETSICFRMQVENYTSPLFLLPEGVELIRTAKQKGVQISCSVALANLCYTDSALFGFDTRFKLTPPLRSEKDRAALKEGLLDGTIDMISSSPTLE